MEESRSIIRAKSERIFRPNFIAVSLLYAMKNENELLVQIIVYCYAV